MRLPGPGSAGRRHAGKPVDNGAGVDKWTAECRWFTEGSGRGDSADVGGGPVGERHDREHRVGPRCGEERDHRRPMKGRVRAVMQRHGLGVRPAGVSSVTAASRRGGWIGDVGAASGNVKRKVAGYSNYAQRDSPFPDVTDSTPRFMVSGETGDHDTGCRSRTDPLTDKLSRVQARPTAAKRCAHGRVPNSGRLPGSGERGNCPRRHEYTPRERVRIDRL